MVLNTRQTVQEMFDDYYLNCMSGEAVIQPSQRTENFSPSLNVGIMKALKVCTT